MSTILAPAPTGVGVPSVEQLEVLVGWLSQVDGDGVDDGVRVDLLGVLERVKSGCAAAQARVTAAFAASQQQ